MSYLNRANGYAPTGNVNSEHKAKHRRYVKDKDNHMQVGKAKAHILNEPWWSDCPVCPIHLGFKMHATHGRALTWALAHVEEHRRVNMVKHLVDLRKEVTE